MNNYYDGTKLLSLLDINGHKPEIYICESNRSAGKTTYYTRLVINRFLKGQGKFAFLYRFNYELKDCADKIFKDVQSLFFPDHHMTSKPAAKGVYHNLYLQKDNEEIPQHCGYALSINSAEQIKRLSHLFSDIEIIIFDEFQSETGRYCNDEIKKFISIHTSIARGQGKQVRYVPVIMISNPISIINPYYLQMDISTRLNSQTKFLRGAGYVLEKNYNETVSAAQKGSGFNQAFSDSKYLSYVTDNIYLNDNQVFISDTNNFGRASYLATIKYHDKNYGLKQYPQVGIIYCDLTPDLTFPLKIALTTEDHQINYIILKNNEMFLSDMRYYFNRGCFRFKNIECKEVIFTLLGIT